MTHLDNNSNTQSITSSHIIQKTTSNSNQCERTHTKSAQARLEERTRKKAQIEHEPKTLTLHIMLFFPGYVHIFANSLFSAAPPLPFLSSFFIDFCVCFVYFSFIFALMLVVFASTNPTHVDWWRERERKKDISKRTRRVEEKMKRTICDLPKENLFNIMGIVLFLRVKVTYVCQFCWDTKTSENEKDKLKERKKNPAKDVFQEHQIFTYPFA